MEGHVTPVMESAEIPFGTGDRSPEECIGAVTKLSESRAEDGNQVQWSEWG